ncbi:unnamed protein product [Owenia fusiformis]|uniref:Uncharacterized protein n=1 Tax=Owenia fusiformis TaxID=6347 RepID=A0A8J1XHA4_OWEFU|nr:unnamed protein product [Owenia fusiformis]
MAEVVDSTEITLTGSTTDFSFSDTPPDTPPVPPDPHEPAVKRTDDAPIAEDEDTATLALLDPNVFLAPECQVDHVVVYLDRAEVCRSLKAKLNRGENEITIGQLSSSIDKDSIRVEGRGAATILEVTYQTKYIRPEENAANQQTKLIEADLKALEKEKSVLLAWQKRVQKQRSVLDGFADNLTKVQEIKDKDGKVTPMCGAMDATVLDGMTGFFTMYDSQATKLDSTLHEIDQKLEDVTQGIKQKQDTLANMDAEKDDFLSRELSVLIGCEADTEVTLLVSYIVTKAKWTPKYDIRVFSNDNQMKIMYYALIQQASGEDWEDAKISLSTAMPSVGGQVPELGTHRLYFKPKPQQILPLSINGLDLPPLSPKNANRSSVRKVKKRPQSVMINAMDLNKSIDEALIRLEGEKYRRDSEVEKDRPQYAEIPTEVKDGITSTTFDIARLHSIPCDNATHKVSVAIIDLTPLFEYECVPKMAAHAYLKARVRNTSSYALLAGPTNIFLDNNFIAKADLKAVSPSEDFTCSLGVDPGIRVQYKPLHKFREQSGIITKTISMTYKQVIEVKNTHSKNIKIIIMDQLPCSTEEKIKVILQEPVIKHPEKYDKNKSTRLNRMNNVEWDIDIPGGETKELTLKYVIEHPVLEDVEHNISRISDY